VNLRLPNAGAVPATVLICSRDRPALLLDTVRSVLEGTELPNEVLVVDQSVVENTELAGMGHVRGCDVRYLHTVATGLSRARNIGLRAASRDVVVMLDDDILVEKDWFASLLRGLPAGPHGVATGRVLAAPPEGDGVAVPPAALVTREVPAVYRGPQDLDVVPGANVALRRQLVLDLGGYDERLGAGTRFSAADDNDMGHRLLLAGCEVRHVPDAVVLHRAWRPSHELVRLRWQYGRGKGAFYAKHIGLGDRHVRRRAAAEVGGRLRRAVAAAIRSPRTTVAELLSLSGMLSGALGWVVRERIPERLRRTDC
jgi:GT2 family glycosyltransferase